MIAAGLPEPKEDHVVACIEIALEMRCILAALEHPEGRDLKLRIGIHTGHVVAGVIGTKKFIYDLWGDDVNIAIRMESHGVADAIQVSESVYNMAKGIFDFEERDTVVIKGKGEMKTFIVRGKKIDPTLMFDIGLKCDRAILPRRS